MSKKLLFAFLAGVFTLTLTAQDSWKKIKLPAGKNLFSNPTFKNGPGNLPYNWNLDFSDGSKNIVCKNGVVTLKKIVPEKRAFQTASGDAAGSCGTPAWIDYYDRQQKLAA